jgi:hypothetical protein
LILAALDQADDVQGMNQPTFRLHPLKGHRAGVWAVTVRANWRVTFRFQDRDAYDVEFQRRNKTMRVKNPVHPGALAKANLEELGLSVAVAAKAMKVAPTAL